MTHYVRSSSVTKPDGHGITNECYIVTIIIVHFSGVASVKYKTSIYFYIDATSVLSIQLLHLQYTDTFSDAPVLLMVFVLRVFS